MIRTASFLLLVGMMTLLAAAPVMAQCLEGNCVNGEGTKLTRGHKYTGSFKDNHRDGYGKYEYPNGDVYEGQFVNGIIEGEGIYFYVGGDRYEGAFKDGKRHGVGTYYPMEGHLMQGVWENGNLAIPEQMVESEELDDSLTGDVAVDGMDGMNAETDAPADSEELTDDELNRMIDQVLQ